MEIGIIALIVFVSLFAIWLIFYFIPVGLWFSALVSGVRISLLQLIVEGGTLRQRIRINWNRLIRTPDTSAENHRPTGMK